MLLGVPLSGRSFLIQNLSLVQHLMSGSSFVEAICGIVSLVLSGLDFCKVELLLHWLISESSPAYFSLDLTV